jgi:hypothetical protein
MRPQLCATALCGLRGGRQAELARARCWRARRTGERTRARPRVRGTMGWPRVRWEVMQCRFEHLHVTEHVSYLCRINVPSCINDQILEDGSDVVQVVLEHLHVALTEHVSYL